MLMYSLGFSNRSTEDLLELLKKYKIKRVVDVRSLPYSRFTTWFNKKELSGVLRRSKIDYVHIPELGGKRADVWEHMETKAYARWEDVLEELADRDTTVFCCTEADYHKCHRRVIAQHMVKRGHRVIHIGG